MKKFITVILITLTSFLGNSQTLIRYDYMETRNWAGLWQSASNTGWSNNAFVSSDLSAILYGNSNGSSPIEDNTYILPNVTGLNSTKQYQLKFRLASYTFTSPSATTRGVDGPDYVSVLLSVNGGPYVTELRITGNSNSLWTYGSTGSITHTANGTFTNSAAPTGDLYQAPPNPPAPTPPTFLSNGPTFITLNLPLGITDVAVGIYCRVNANGEEWWLDNIELWDTTPIGLPVELISFEGINTEEGNLLVWKTASEHNSDYYLIESSTTGEFNENSVIGQNTAAGNSNQLMEYSFLDVNFSKEINYYRITQVDFDGNFKVYGPIDINNLESKKEIVKYVNPLGQEVGDNYKGILFEVYSDGTTKKIYR